MQFEIKAYRHQEGVIALSLEAGSLDEVRSQARQRGLDIVSIRQRGLWQGFRRKDRPFDLMLFSQELRSLLDAGLSLIESLGALSRKETSPGKRQLIENLMRQLREGMPFSSALKELPVVFPPLYVALTAASEQTGDLASALARYIEYRSQMDTARKKLISAAIYPSLLAGVGGLVILFLMTYVVPRFSRIYDDFGREIPFMSKLLMQWGSLVQAHGLHALLGLAALTALLAPVLGRKFDLQHVLGSLLSLKPLRPLRDRVDSYALSRFYRTLGLLQQGGIPIVSALELARGLLAAEMQTALNRVLVDIRAGGALSDTMARNGLAPPVANDLLKVGERTGAAGEKMIRIADFYDEDLTRWTDWFMRLAEPLLMLAMGLFIALIVVLLYMPIFELAGSVQ